MATQKELRGRGVNGMIAAATVGVALAYWVDFGMVFTHGTDAVWRFPVAFHSFFALCTIIGFWSLPDTPRYFYAKGQTAQADSVLEQLYASPLSEPHVQHAKDEIIASLELERADSATLKITDFFWDTSSLQAARRIRTGVFLVGIAYLMGINVIFYYTTTIFQVYIGLAPLTASGLAGAANTVLAIANLLGVYFLEKFGRRTWLIAGAASQTVFMAAFTGLLSTPGPKTGAAAAAMLFAWIVYVYASEIVPLRYRHIGFALSVSAQWLMAFVTVFAGPIAIADPSVGWKTWIWFLVFNFIAVPYETRGHTLEEIDLIFVADEKLKQSEAAQMLQEGEVKGGVVSVEEADASP
ncbi:MAG: hypothetical protein Q9227_005663 [Pyrenula ochraceoflavens]